VEIPNDGQRENQQDQVGNDIRHTCPVKEFILIDALRARKSWIVVGLERFARCKRSNGICDGCAYKDRSSGVDDVLDRLRREYPLVQHQDRQFGEVDIAKVECGNS